MTLHPQIGINAVKFILRSEHHVNDAFLASIVPEIFNILKTLPIVHTYTGNWVRPNQGIILPRQLYFEGEPIFSEPDLRNCKLPYEHIDPLYDRLQSITTLRNLGCHTVSLDHVLSMLTTPLFELSTKPYSLLAILLDYLCEKNLTFAKGRLLSVLKLSNGSWTSLEQCNDVVFFPSMAEFDSLAFGLPILDQDFYSHIAERANADQFLRRTLKIKELGETGIIKGIIAYHENGGSLSFGILSHDICFAHAEYISKRRYLLAWYEIDQLKKRFHFVDHRDHIVKGVNGIVCDREVRDSCASAGRQSIKLSECIVSGPIRFTNKRYSANALELFRHSLSMQAFPSLLETQSYSRLSKRRRLVVEKKPVLATFYSEVLSPRQWNRNFILYYLAEIWDEIQNRPPAFDKGIREVEVLCENGNFARLEGCFLRTKSIDAMLTNGMNGTETQCTR